MTRSARRRRGNAPTPAQVALGDWLTLRMGDPVAARLAYRVIGLHAGLVAWIADAEHATALPAPFRLPGDERPGGVTVGSAITHTRDPDDAMLRLVTDRLDAPGTYDPEFLQPVRLRIIGRFSEFATWYSVYGGLLTVEEWEPLAVRLGDLTGDEVASNALAVCLIRHATLATPGWERERKNARERWRRLAAWMVRLLDQQPEKGRLDRVGRVAIQTVHGDGQRQIG